MSAPNLDELIRQISAYRESVEQGAIPDPSDAQKLEVAIANLQLRLYQAYADGGNIEPTTLELIERIDAYEQGLAEGSLPDDESLRALQESAATLLTTVWEQTGEYFGFLCTEMSCPARQLTHFYGDNVCGYEFAIRPKKKD